MRYQKRQFTFPALAATFMLLAAGCSADPASQPTITQQQAVARVDRLLRDTGAAITPRPRLVVDKPGTQVTSCLEEPEGSSDARVQPAGEYFLQGVPQQARASVAEQIMRFWKAKGYAVDAFHMGTSDPQVHGTTQDNFLVALEPNGGGELSIGASSPCVWPNGTPPPPSTAPP